MNCMIYRHGDTNCFCICPACSMGLLQNEDPKDQPIPIYYSEQHAKDMGWRFTYDPFFCTPGKDGVWICPDCWPGDAKLPSNLNNGRK